MHSTGSLPPRCAPQLGITCATSRLSPTCPLTERLRAPHHLHASLALRTTFESVERGPTHGCSRRAMQKRSPCRDPDSIVVRWRHVEVDCRGACFRSKGELSLGGLRRTREGSIRRSVITSSWLSLGRFRSLPGQRPRSPFGSECDAVALGRGCWGRCAGAGSRLDQLELRAVALLAGQFGDDRDVEARVGYASGEQL